MPARRSPAARRAALLLVPLLAAGCDDGRLSRLQGKVDADLIELQAIASDPVRFRAELDHLLRTRDEAHRELREAAAALEALGASAGLEVEARSEPSAASSWTRQVRFRRDGPPSATLAALEELELPRGARFALVRCTTGGCRVTLEAPTPPPPAAAPPHDEPIPPRPWWPPAAKRWERLRRSLEERARLRASLDDAAVGGVRWQQREVTALLEVLYRHRVPDPVLQSALEARAAGARAFEVSRDPRGEVVVVAPGRQRSP